jgi:adenine phosphoribosyltransferase
MDPQELRVLTTAGIERGQLGHPLDPRYGAVDPADLESAAARLAGLVNASDFDRILGLPEGGIAVAYAVARHLGRPLVSSSRNLHEDLKWIHFDEPHCAEFQRTHYVYALEPGQRVLIVEDELNSGDTVVNAVRALRSAGMVVKDVVALYASEEQHLWDRIAAEGLRLQVNRLIPTPLAKLLAGALSG